MWWLNGASRWSCGEHYLAMFKLCWSSLPEEKFTILRHHVNYIHRESILMHILKSEIMKGNINEKVSYIKMFFFFFLFNVWNIFLLSSLYSQNFCLVDLFLLFTVGWRLNSSYMLFAFYTTCHNLYWL